MHFKSFILARIRQNLDFSLVNSMVDSAGFAPDVCVPRSLPSGMLGLRMLVKPIIICALTICFYL